jgi:hypothetical protein
MEGWFKTTEISKFVVDVWVKDLHATAASYSERFGLGPWKFSELKAPILSDARFRGEPVEVDILAAMNEIGPLAIELLQIRGGSDSIMRWAEELPERSWHPVAYFSKLEDAEAAREEFEAKGFRSVLSGRVADSRFYMLDAYDLLGTMFEIAGGGLAALEWSTIE